MRLSELLSRLTELAKENSLSEPYIVGGVPRDKAFGVPASIKDIDLSTGDDGSLSLAMAASREWSDSHFKVFNDGHATLMFENIQVDFSNNYQAPGIEKELKSIGIDNPTEMQKEVFSRDFTINTLAQPMDLSKGPIDLTGMAFEDIKNKVLRTPIDARITIGHDPRRIIRAMKLSMKFNLKVAPSLKSAIIKYRGGVRELPMQYVKRQINEMLDMDPKWAIELLSEYKLLPIIPLSKLMMQELSKNRMIQHLLED